MTKNMNEDEYFAMARGADEVKIWVFPDEDFPLWVKHCNGAGTLRQRKTTVALYIAELERIGCVVETVSIPVRTMLEELDRRKLANNETNRALIVGEWTKSD